MRSQLKLHIENELSFLNGKKLLLACSGGLDSVVLVHLMKQLDFDISLAHCNFSLRGKESDGDEMFVIGLAKNLSVPVFAETFDTKKYAKEHKLSTQMAARELRYTWFEEIVKDFNFDFLLTAHHLDDDLETFFINLSRGTGLKGLTGIPQLNDKLVRPLLIFSREEILKYATKYKLVWREDSSNSKTDYLRNKLRLEVLPDFKEINDSVLKNFQKTRQNLRSSQNLIEDYMTLIYNIAVTEIADGYKIDIAKLKELPHTDALIYELLYGFGFTSWEDVAHLLDAQTGKQVLSKTHRLLKDRNSLILTQIGSESDISEFFISKDEKEIFHPIHLKIEAAEFIGETEKNLIYVDFQKLKFPLKLRKWRDGDSFQPFGMEGKKKLSKYFKDEKLSLNTKEKTWLLLSNDEIVWVVDFRMDDRFKVTERTKKILKITYN